MIVRKSGPDIEPDDRMLVDYARTHSAGTVRLGLLACPDFDELWHAGCFDIYETPAPSDDPRDAAIAKWPWMERFRGVKSGDVFRIENTTYRPIRTVASVRWVEGHLTWDFDSTWSMASDAGWDLLQPYRMPSPAKPAAPTCNTCHKPEPLGYAGRCWPCELRAEATVAAETDGYLGSTEYQRDGNVIYNDWADRIRADMAIAVSPLPGGASFGALWRGRVPKL